MRKICFQFLVCLLLASKASLAAGIDYSQKFDFSAAPITLTAGGAPLLLQIDFGQRFDSYGDIFIKINLLNSTKFITTQGFALSNQTAPPSYASLTDWGYAVMTGTTQSVTPSVTFSWNSGWGSEHWIDVGAPEISNEILDGKFIFYFQNAPLSLTPSLTSKDDIVVGSAEVILRGAVVSTVPEPTSAHLVYAGIVCLILRLRSGRRSELVQPCLRATA
jgi:hypothetical protein